MPTEPDVDGSAPRQLKSWYSREVMLAAIGAIAFACLLGFPLIVHFHKIGVVWDWDAFLERDWVPAYTLRHFHQLPLWNPYTCGGMPMWANPEARIATPLFLFHLLFGPVAGLHLEILADLAIAWAGGYCLGRWLGLTPIGAVACACVFPASSWFSLHLAVGHLSFLTSLFLPWILALTWHSVTRDSPISAALAGLAMAFTLGGGGVYQVVQAAFLVTLIGGCVAIQRRSVMPFVMLSIFGCFGVGFSAVKLIPGYVLMHQHPREVYSADYSPMSLLLDALLSRDQTMAKASAPWGYWDVGAYVGPIAATMSIVGVAASFRKALPWLFAAIVCFLLAMGEILPHYSPWQLIHALPILDSTRVAPRFLIPFTMMISVLAALGIDFLTQHQNLAGKVTALALIGVSLLDLWNVSFVNTDYFVQGDPPSRSESALFHQFYDHSRRTWPGATASTTTEMNALAHANTGVINCYEYTTLPTSVTGNNQPGYRGEQYFTTQGELTLNQ
jgi:hypothetical protein